MKASVAVNEAIFLLDSLARPRLDELRRDFPSLSNDLKIGIVAGPEEEVHPDAEAAIISAKAEIMIAALSEAAASAKRALELISHKVRLARRQRLASQILVLIGSSSSLATLALSHTRAAVISSVLTLLAAVGSILADYQEKLLNPQAGNIYDAFQRLSEAVYKSRTMSSDLELALKYSQPSSQVAALISNANALCEQLNGWLIQMVTSQ